jgi:hypothetical protein
MYKNLSSKVNRERKVERKEPDIIELDEIYVYIKKQEKEEKKSLFKKLKCLYAYMYKG